MWNIFKRAGPSDAEINDLRTQHPYTPDLVGLHARPFHLLFVYDRMQSFQADEAFFGGEAMELGTVFTKDKFALVKRTIGYDSYPIPMVESPFSAPELSVRGELRLIPTDKLIELDTERKNGVKFQRRIVTVTMPYRRRTKSRLNIDLQFHNYKCWMYVGVQDFWASIFNDHQNFHMFDAVARCTPNKQELKEYYYFSKSEYDDS